MPEYNSKEHAKGLLDEAERKAKKKVSEVDIGPATRETFVPPMPQGVSLSPQEQPVGDLPPYLSTIADTIYPKKQVGLVTRGTNQPVVEVPSPGALQQTIPGGITFPTQLPATSLGAARDAQIQAISRNPSITPEELRAIADEIYRRGR